MDRASGFGGAVNVSSFHFPAIDPNNPMNQYYLSQIEQHAQRNPTDVYAQQMLAHWRATLQLYEQQRLMQAAATAGPPSQV